MEEELFVEEEGDGVDTCLTDRDPAGQADRAGEPVSDAEPDRQVDRELGQVWIRSVGIVAPWRYNAAGPLTRSKLLSRLHLSTAPFVAADGDGQGGEIVLLEQRLEFRGDAAGEGGAVVDKR